MGHIVARKRRDGSTGYTAQIVLKKDGKVAHREAKTFDRRQAANAWMARREDDLAKPGAIQRTHQNENDPKLRDVIDRYTDKSERQIGRTKAQVLRSIKDYEIAEMRCSEITSADLVAFAEVIPASPATRQNYLSHLSAIFKLAKPAWGYPLDYQAIRDALVATKNLGLTAKGKFRKRRPTFDELDRLMEHFGQIKARRPASIPMQQIIAFAIFSTRRQEEITRIRWDDFEPAQDGEAARILVRDMKSPGDKLGNDVRCELPPEAVAIIESMPKIDDRIFPFTVDAISAAFTRACQFLGIDDLHFHDLRHEGVSRLFEIGKDIPRSALVSGHKSWSSLQRYAHIRRSGDKYANWKWRLPAKE
ncbi:MAG TPA: site-specific integrase [Pseudolabrys sp.]|nr:site-specific integrase [Pseudolabrys sp.]